MTAPNAAASIPSTPVEQEEYDVVSLKGAMSPGRKDIVLAEVHCG